MSVIPALLPGTWPGLLCGLLFLFLQNHPTLRGLERSTLDSQFRYRGVRDADSRLAVIEVDNNSVHQWGGDSSGGWPLPRKVFAQAVARLNEAGARTIALDVLFLEPSGDARDDASLIAACGDRRNVVLADVLRLRSELLTDHQSTSDVLPSRLSVQVSGGTARRVNSAVPPYEPLMRVAAGVGHVTVFPEESGTLRRVPHLLGYHGRLFPSLSLAATANYLGLDQSELEALPGAVRIGPKRIFPLDENGDAPVNWVGGNASHPTFPLLKLLDGSIPPEALRDKLVLIGVTADGAFESRSTPFSNSQPALEIQANAIDNLLSNRPLLAVPAWLTVITALWFPLACGLVVANRRLGGLLWIAGMAAGLWSVSLWALQHDLYWPVGVPLLAGLCAGGSAAATGFRREWDANGRADAAVAALARGTTLLGAAPAAPAGGSRDRLHAVIRATARETLGAREVFLVLLNQDQSGEDTPAEALARRALEQGHTLLWPASALSESRPGGGLRRLRRVRAAGADTSLFESVSKWLRRPIKGDAPLHEFGHAGSPTRLRFSRLARVRPTLVMAPFPSLALTGDDDHLPHRVEGALLAMDRRDGGLFTLRDAALLEALAKQAALALDNWEYGEALRGRVELANRELSGAYRLLAEQSAKLFAAVESIEAAIVVSDQDGIAMFVNPAGGRVLRGATPILGEPVGSALASGDLEELAVLFDSMRLRGQEAGRTRLETTRGREILSAQFTPLQEHGGPFLGAMLVVTDITAQRELDRMKTDFVGFVAHELRTPLTTILGYASLLDQSSGRLTPEQTREMTSVITRHCRRMNRLINDLLDISRLEAGEPLPLQTMMFDVRGLVDRLADELRSQLNPVPPIRLVIDGPPGPMEIIGDPDRFEQVVINLLGNAIKYSPDGGEIRVRLVREQDEMSLEIQDQGMGMTPEQVSNLFTKFYRSPDARARGIKGTGLGLHLVRQIIESHGGGIQVQSTPGRGSTFRVTLPLGPRIR